MFGVFGKVSSWASLWIYSSAILEVGPRILLKQAAQVIPKSERC